MKAMNYSVISAISYRFTAKTGEVGIEMPSLKFGTMVKETEKAICFYMRRYNMFGLVSEGNCWIPKSQILEVLDGDKGSSGIAIVPEWLCKKIELSN